MLKLSKKDMTLLFSLVNIWLGFVLFLWVISHLPHWENLTTFLSWVNEAFYFLLFLLSLSIFLRESNNKFIFLNLTVYFLANWLSISTIFTGNAYIIGSDALSYRLFHYKSMITTFLFDFTVIFAVVRYILPDRKSILHYLLTAAVVFPVFLFVFFPYLRDPLLMFNQGEAYFARIGRCIVSCHGLALAFLILYGVLLFRTDQVLGVYINLLLACMFVILAVEIVNFSFFPQLFLIYNFSQVVLTLNLVFLSFILFKKFCYNCSEYGKFYESLISRKISLGKIEIQRYRSETNAFLLRALKLYITQRRRFLFLVVLVFGLSAALYRFPGFYTLIVCVFSFSIAVLLLFFDALHRKREKERFILPHK